MPCQWIDVASGSRFTSVISTGSPRLSTSGGPGTGTGPRAAAAILPASTNPRRRLVSEPARLALHEQRHPAGAGVERAGGAGVLRSADDDRPGPARHAGPEVVVACRGPRGTAASRRRAGSARRATIVWQWNNQLPARSGVHVMPIVEPGAMSCVTTRGRRPGANGLVPHPIALAARPRSRSRAGASGAPACSG